MSEEWKTTIGEIHDGEYHLRGQKITDLMQTSDWIGTMILGLIGRSPTEQERILLSACLIAAMDHGMSPPSAHVTRVITSCGKPIADSVAGGLLTLGPRHGNAAGAAAEWLKKQIAEEASVAATVQNIIQEKIRLSGFGHAEYERDPRAVTLAEMTNRILSVHPHMTYALEIAKELTAQKDKPLYLNIDGAIGAVVADLGLPSELADTLFLIARTVGLSAHALEETKTAKTYRRF